MQSLPRTIRLLILLWAVLPVSCKPPDRHLIHPTAVPSQVQTWSDDITRGPLAIHLEWAKPPESGPFPTVLVHPDGGNTAVKMRGVIWDLASHGYLAVAASYRRLLHGTYRWTLFPWRQEQDVTAVLNILQDHPLVDPDRLAVLGFSQGGVFSLLMAARFPTIKAVVAYYPVTDFAHWFAHPRPLVRRIVFGIIKWYFRRQSGARSKTEFEAMLRQASPLHQAEHITAPVLLIHGARDDTAPLAESRRLADRLEALGREVKLLVIPEGHHVFNFKQPAQARRAWRASLAWLARHLDRD